MFRFYFDDVELNVFRRKIVFNIFLKSFWIVDECIDSKRLNLFINNFMINKHDLKFLRVFIINGKIGTIVYENF